jgi:hypothetical protein
VKKIREEMKATLENLQEMLLKGITKLKKVET